MEQSFTIDDFTSEEWLERPEYKDGEGIWFSHVIALHEEQHPYTSLRMFDALEKQIYVFAYVIDLEFRIYIYSTHSVVPYSTVSLTPLTMLQGTTHDGVRETYQAPCISEQPEFLSEVYAWLAQYIADMGWKKG